MRIPGRGCAGGCVAMISDAAGLVSMWGFTLCKGPRLAYAIVVLGRSASTTCDACFFVFRTISSERRRRGGPREGIGKRTQMRLLEF